MGYMKMKRVVGILVMTAVIAIPFASMREVRASNDGQRVDLPYVCDGLQVPSDNRLAFRVYAVGVQSYRWNGTSWAFVEPIATLYADPQFTEKVGTHYAGPTWEGNDGSKVVATRLADCSPDPTAIPWLLLQASTNSGPGIFDAVTFIQRVNTKGGLAPTAPGASTGVVAQIPYTTEYYFYRARR